MRRIDKAFVPLEKDIQKSFIRLAATLGVTLHRQNTGMGQYRNKDCSKRVVRYGQAGNLDLTGILPGGRHLEVEVKRPGNKPTDKQQSRIEQIKSVGGVAFWADNIDDFMRQLREALG